MRDVGLVAITAACNVTGELMPYDEVIRMAHRYGSMVLVDAAQIVGWQDLDLPRLSANVVAFGGHKGLQAPWGIGGLYLSDRAGMECTSAQCDLPSAGESKGIVTQRPGYCDVGSVDQYALAGLHAAVGLFCACGRIARHTWPVFLAGRFNGSVRVLNRSIVFGSSVRPGRSRGCPRWRWRSRRVRAANSHRC